MFHVVSDTVSLRSEQDAEEGDVIAWWSQSERALRGAYGPNLHSTLASNDGRPLTQRDAIHLKFSAPHKKQILKQVCIYFPT